MLRQNYSPELATGVIAASGTLGQVIPPSIIIVFLGTLAGDLHSTAQEARAGGGLLGRADLSDVAPAEITAAQIYRGVLPFVLIQIVGLAILWVFPGIVTIVRRSFRTEGLSAPSGCRAT